MFSPKEKETQTFRSAPTLNGTGGNVRGLEKKLVFKCLYQIIALRFSQMRIRDNDFPACERSVIGNLVKDFLIFRNILAEKLSKLLANLLGLRPSKAR